MSKLHLPRLTMNDRIANDDGKPSATFLRYINNALASIEGQATDLVGQNTAISDAQAQASSAVASAAGAVMSVSTSTAAIALALSYTTPTDLLTAAYDANTGARTIAIAGHTRHYADGNSVAVSAGSIASVQPATTYYVTYQDASRSGGTVSYTASTNAAVISQVQGRHLIGSITTGAA